MSDLGNPELPEPEKAPPGEDIPPTQPQDSPVDPSLNGNGGGTYQPPQGQAAVDMEKLVQWMKHTDKQLVMLTFGQVALAAAVMFILWKAKGDVVKVAKP